MHSDRSLKPASVHRRGMTRDDWRRDPKIVRDIVRVAKADGFRLSTIISARGILLRYSRFLAAKFKTDFPNAGWEAFVAYKSHLAKSGISATTIRSYVYYLAILYRLLAKKTEDSRHFDLYARIRAVGVPRRARSVRWRPFALETLRRILEAAKTESQPGQEQRKCQPEDYVFIATLLFTGGRAQFYGLRRREVDFRTMEISTIVKPGKRITIPLHPSLAELLKEHFAIRGYRSGYVFRYGRDPNSRTGLKSNRQHAWRVCKRVQSAAALDESVHPHRFRKTLATLGRKLGMDPQSLQAILGHETLAVTLDHYAQVDLDDVKREYAKLDLLGEGSASQENNVLESVRGLKGLAPSGREHAWNMHVEGLLALLEDQTATSDRGEKLPRYVRIPRKTQTFNHDPQQGAVKSVPL